MPPHHEGRSGCRGGRGAKVQPSRRLRVSWQHHQQNVGPEIKRRTGYAWNCFLKYSRAVYDSPYIAVADKVRFLKAEVLEVMLYGCVTWTLSPGDFDKLREAHRGMLLKCLNAYTSTRAAPDYHMLSYLEVLLRTDCECIEATVMKRILHYAGRVARMHNDRLPNIVM